MDSEDLSPGWKQVDAFDRNARDYEDRILEVIANPWPFLDIEVNQLQAMITLNRNFAKGTFHDLVRYDIEILLDLVERNLLDSEGR